MDIELISEKLTVYFDDPFWVGVFEHTESGKLSVSKVTFGAEPKDYKHCARKPLPMKSVVG